MLLANWALVEADLHERYGVDVESGVLDVRSWRWLRIRVGGLLRKGTRIGDLLASEED